MKTVTYLILVNVILRCSLGENLKLLILHNNDMHSRFEETSRTSGICKDKSNCYGGFARVLHVVRQARKAAADGTGPPVLFLNAGDTYTGTAWFSVHKWKIAADFLNLLHPDVACLGNHEFDYDVAGLLPLLHAVNFPIVTANLNLSRERELEASELKESHVMEISGHKIGVIGYLLPDTVQLASTSNVIFLDEVSAIKEESERLNRNGVKIIIALGHSGYKKDLEIAENVPLVDLVVGGHSNTFLWNGAKPDDEEVEGPYPVTVKQASGKHVPIVHAYAFTKYMGQLSVEFDEEGNLVEYAGQPLLLDNHVDQEIEALVLMEKYRDELKDLMSENLGETKVILDGRVEVCRSEECSIGNFMSDAFVRYHAEMYNGMYWTDASIALYNAGSIRNSLAIGNITKEALLYAFPYTDLVCTLTLNGSDLLKALEIGVRGNGETSYGEFLQVSGIRYQIDRSRPPGSRILEAKARCAACSIPQYQIIQPQKSYKIITRKFLCDGGDGFSVFKDNDNKVMKSVTEFDIAVWYINRTSPIYTGNEDRILNVEHSVNSASLLTMTLSLFHLITLVSVCLIIE